LDNLTKLPRNEHWKGLYKIQIIYAAWKSKMAATAIDRLTLNPMGKCSNAFFSETTNMIKAKLKNVKFVENHPRNIHVQFGVTQICSF
jgi:hypothetical protein